MAAAAAFLAALSGAWTATTGGKAVAEPAIAMERTLNGIRLIAMAPAADTEPEISILPAAAGLDRIAAALTLIERKSPANFRTIERLKAAGPVSLIYYPNNFRDRNRLNTQTVALFLPDFLKRRGMNASAKDPKGREFTVVINQFGVKWPAGELAAVIVHELAGHGVQHLQDRIATGRLLDLECEASLYQEQAYQDFGVAKKSRAVVLFRRQMENHYCADFRTYMQDRMPGKLALWDTLNPNVATLLDMFSGYRGTQSASNAVPNASQPRPLSSRSR